MAQTQTQQNEEIESTEREKELAEQFGVEVKTVQLLWQIVDDVLAVREHNAEVGEFDRERLLALRFKLPVEKVRELGGLTAALLERMLKGQSEQNAKAEPAGEQPQKEPQQQDVASLAEARVRQWLLSRDLQTKLAVILMDGYSSDDHGTQELRDNIIDTYEADVFNAAANPTEQASSEDLFMAGVCAELLIWRKHS